VRRRRYCHGLPSPRRSLCERQTEDGGPNGKRKKRRAQALQIRQTVMGRPGFPWCRGWMRCVDCPVSIRGDCTDCSGLLQIPVSLSEDTPMEVVVQMFQRLGLRFVLLSRYGTLRGILTKSVSTPRRSAQVVREC
jgi:hypothetical protein